MGGITKTIRGMIIELVNINGCKSYKACKYWWSFSILGWFISFVSAL